MGDTWQFRLVESLEKVFPDETPAALPPNRALSAFRGERLSVQVAFRPPDGSDKPGNSIKVDVVSADAALGVAVSSVDLVPCELAAHPGHDDTYLRGSPGLYPDILRPVDDGVVEPIAGGWRAAWVDLSVGETAPAGLMPVRITCQHVASGATLFDTGVRVDVIAATGPPLDIVNTQWFHADGLADYYGDEIFADGHWDAIDAFVASAARMDVNALLAPVWTPPVDTAVGARRRQVQLVRITCTRGEYEFGFDRLGRWLDICSRHGIETIEIPHFFTQWGARATPSIVAMIDGHDEAIFGWHRPADSPDYRQFLEQFVPALRSYLDREWAPREVIYHVSDEPSVDDGESYRRARATVADLLKGCTIVDAMSSYELFETGSIDTPVVATDSVEPFLDAGVRPLWVYFCVSQHRGVANRFIAMRSAVSRLLGLQLFAADVDGLLHWGFNYYYSALSERFVDPFRDASGAGTFLAGDPFIVYPGPNRQPWESIRHRLSAQAMFDHRACQFVRDRIGRDETLALVEADGELTFSTVDHAADRIRAVRRRIDDAARRLTT